MDRSINPVSGRTRLQMSSRNALIQRRAQQSSRRPETSTKVPKSEPETEPKSNNNNNNNNNNNPSAVEFLLVDQEGNVKKFYIDEMELKSHDPDSVVQARVSSLRRSCSVNNVQSISSDSENDKCPSKKGKKIVKGATSVLPICIISDDDDEEEQVNGHKDAYAKKIKGGDASTSMPLKKRHKGAGGRFIKKEMTENPVGGRIIKKEMAEKPLGGRIVKKEMMEASHQK